MLNILKSKKHECPKCKNGFASPQSLWNHKKRCQDGQEQTRKMRPLHNDNDTPTFVGSHFGTDKPKSKETMDKLRRHVLGNNTAVKPPPLKTVRMDTSLYSHDDNVVIPKSKTKSQIVNSVL